MKDDVRALLGERIKAIRKARDLSQDELAQVAHMDRVFLGQLERGQRGVTVETLDRLARALGLEAKEFLDFKRTAPKPPKLGPHDALARRVAVLARSASPWELKKFLQLAEVFFQESQPRRKRQ